MYGRPPLSGGWTSPRVIGSERDAGKARNFGAIILGFLAGAVAGSRLTLWLGPHTIWLAAAVLVAALGLFVLDARRTR